MSTLPAPPPLYFFLKLLAPRPGFNQDMSSSEKDLMHQHFNYWKALQDQGKVVVFGPVLDPQEIFGMAIVVANREDEIQQITDHDPAVKSGLLKPVFHPMRAILP